MSLSITPSAKTKTRRRALAHQVRQTMARYRNGVTDQESRSAIVDILQAQADLEVLLHLETGGTYGDLHADAQSVLRAHRQKLAERYARRG